MALLPVPVAPAEIQDDQALGPMPEALRAAFSAACEFALAEKSQGTRRAYASDLAAFAEWCDEFGLCPAPAAVATVASYLAHLANAGLKASTIKRKLAAIRYSHRIKGLESPAGAEVVKSVHRGIRNRIGTRAEQKAPATAETIAKMVKRIPRDTLSGKRDRALILLGFGAALRRSELVGLDMEDLVHHPDGVMVTIRRSKTDQEGRGQEVAVPRGSKLRVPTAIEDWTAAAGIAAGPLFRRVRRGDRLTDERLTPHAVGEIVKRWASAAKLDPAMFAGHSLRAGFVTSALEAGADVFAAADQGRWRKLETVREYDRRAKAFKNNAGRSFL
jgi:site-specific recombinase XerD